MISKAFESIKKHEMLKDVKKVVVGFSGGADSTALLHFLYFFASEKGKNFEVEAVHVNHGLRGQEALRDQNFAQLFCKKFGIKITVKNVDIKKISKECKIGTEEAGRNERYKIFEEFCKDKSVRVATAHTLSDNCETFIINLARGSSLRGLCAIPPVRENIIRPFIGVTRSEVENYCKENNLEYIHDSSNFEEDYTRNKIRINVIPRLKKLNPNFEKAVGKTVDLICEDEKYLEDLAEKEFSDLKLENGYNAEKIKNLPPCLKSRVTVKIIKSVIKKPVESKHVDMVLKVLEGKILKAAISQGAFFKCENNILMHVEDSIKSTGLWEYPLKNFNVLTEIKTNIIIKIIPILEYKKINKDLIFKVLGKIDFEKIPPQSVVRNRRAHDKFTFFSRNVTKSVKKIMNEFKVPAEIRDKVPVIAFKNDVIWIDGIGVSKKYMPDKNTQKIAIIYKEQIK